MSTVLGCYIKTKFYQVYTETWFSYLAHPSEGKTSSDLCDDNGSLKLLLRPLVITYNFSLHPQGLLGTVKLYWF